MSERVVIRRMLPNATTAEVYWPNGLPNEDDIETLLTVLDDIERAIKRRPLVVVEPDLRLSKGTA